MPRPELEWTTVRVSATADSPLRSPWETGIGAEAGAVEIQLPNLAAWPGPLDKAGILLESAAEIEHALMVQYLYAAYSLKGSGEVAEPAQQAALDETSSDSWLQVLLDVAREEMGHLLTVQHLLLALGLAPNFEREDFPPRKDLYPFSLHLEPLSQTSLAKYVVAEAPANAAGIEDVVEAAQAAAGAAINRVGMVYGLLGVVFTEAEVIATGGSGSEAWDELLRALAEAAYRQAPPASWHLPDSAFHPDGADRQAAPEDWQVGGLRVHRVVDRATALQAIRDLSEQGEGATGEPDSHFERLLGVYRGGGGRAPFPAAGEWQATRGVPTDPKADSYTDPRTRLRAELADLRYALLLGFVEHYLLSAGDEREILAGWIVAEMRSRVAPLARQLTTMPREPGGASVAALPFSLPPTVRLPSDEPGRWLVHRERTEAAIATLEEAQAADAADAADGFLTDLLASDRARLAFIRSPGDAAPVATSFARDVQPLFRPKDVAHMAGIGLDLNARAAVRDAAENVLRRVQSSGPRRMPPAPDRRWTPAQIRLFQRWIADGFPE